MNAIKKACQKTGFAGFVLPFGNKNIKRTNAITPIDMDITQILTFQFMLLNILPIFNKFGLK